MLSFRSILESGMKYEDELLPRLELLRLKTRLAGELSRIPHLRPISDCLQRDISLPALLMQALQSAEEISGSDLGNIQLCDGQSGSLKIVVQHGFNQAFLEYFNQVHEGQCGCGSALQRRARVIVEDVSSDAIFKGTTACGVMLQAEARACQSTPIMRRDGTVIGMISTHYRKFPGLQEAQLLLLDGVAQRTAELVEAAEIERMLRQKEREAAAAELAGTLAHEINNPLQALTNLVALMSREPNTPEARAWLTLAQEELEKMIELTHRLLLATPHGRSSMISKANTGGSD